MYKDVNQGLVSPTCAFAYAFNISVAKICASRNQVIDLPDWPIDVSNKINFLIVKEPSVSVPQDPNLLIIGNRYSVSTLTRI